MDVIGRHNHDQDNVYHAGCGACAQERYIGLRMKGKTVNEALTIVMREMRGAYVEWPPAA